MLFDSYLLARISEGDRENNLQGLARLVLDEVGMTDLTIEGVVPAEGPVLMISNHPGVFDSLVLGSAITRQDFYFVALATYGIFGVGVKKQLLPIYRKRRWNHRLYEYPLSLQIERRLPERLSMEDIRRRNQATIARAAELVNRGNMVSIFPSGSGGQALSGSSWKPGVGYLVSQISEPETRIVFAQIEGTKKSDIVAYMQPVVRKLWFRQRPINLRFSRPKRLIEIVGQLSDPKIIAKELERRYTAQMS